MQIHTAGGRDESAFRNLLHTFEQIIKSIMQINAEWRKIWIRKQRFSSTSSPKRTVMRIKADSENKLGMEFLRITA